MESTILLHNDAGDNPDWRTLPVWVIDVLDTYVKVNHPTWREKVIHIEKQVEYGSYIVWLRNDKNPLSPLHYLIEYKAKAYLYDGRTR